MMRRRRISIRARYSAENMEAYQAGKAANMPAPATMSHTSLPSQNGPMLLMATRRSMSVLPTSMWRLPTPRSKPSRMKKPVQKKAMMMNQKICSPMLVS